MGLEPTNGGTTIRCLNQLGDGHHMHDCRTSSCVPPKTLFLLLYSWSFSSPDNHYAIVRDYRVSTSSWIRTNDLPLMRRALLPTELYWHIRTLCPILTFANFYMRKFHHQSLRVEFFYYILFDAYAYLLYTLFYTKSDYKLFFWIASCVSPF